MTAPARPDASSVPKVVVWGTGSIGRRHLQVLKDGGFASPIALSARGQRSLGSPLTDIPTVASLEEAVERGAVAAIIATNTSRHVEDSVNAARVGLKLLVEKPLSVEARESDLLRREVQALGIDACVGYCLRFHPALRTFREYLPQIGPVHHVRIACQSYLPDWRPEADHRKGYSARATEGGVLRDLSHELDYALWIFGLPRMVTATLSSSGRLGIESEESADVTWLLGDMTISFRLDYMTRATRRTMHAFGELGELSCDLGTNEVAIRIGEATGRYIPLPDIDRNTVLANQARAFLHGPSGSDWLTLASLEDAQQVVAICDAARRASETGQSQAMRKLDEIP